jgi:hypothetical protein
MFSDQGPSSGMIFPRKVVLRLIWNHNSGSRNSRVCRINHEGYHLNDRRPAPVLQMASSGRVSTPIQSPSQSLHHFQIEEDIF